MKNKSQLRRSLYHQQSLRSQEQRRVARSASLGPGPSGVGPCTGPDTSDMKDNFSLTREGDTAYHGSQGILHLGEAATLHEGQKNGQEVLVSISSSK